VPRLFDLVRTRDEKLRPAFFYALGDTVVAENLEQASRIAYGRDKRWSRAVTLQVALLLRVFFLAVTALTSPG
jgi:structural maintenance of chromosome 4